MAACACARMHMRIYPRPAHGFGHRHRVSLSCSVVSVNVSWRSVRFARLPTVNPQQENPSSSEDPLQMRLPSMKPYFKFKIPDKSPEPQPESGGEKGQSPERRDISSGDRYRLVLLNEQRHTQELVTTVLPKVVPTVTAEDAKRCFDESREKGFSIVVVSVKEHVEFYVQMLAQSGIRAAIEPDTDAV